MSQSNTAKRIGSACFVMFVGGLFVWKGLESEVSGKASVDWPATDARITESEWRTGASSGSTNTSSWYPHVKYDYTVDGTSYTGTRLTFASTEDLPKHFLDEFPVGAIVPVYYDPARPDTSVLITGASSVATMMAALGAVAICVAIAMIVFAARNARQIQQA